MKIAIICKSILLEKALNIFLEAYIVPFEKCDFFISDVKAKTKKPIFVINKKGHISIPFSKDSLMFALEKFYKSIPRDANLDKKTDEEQISLDLQREITFEARLEYILRKFKEDIINLMQETNEKNF